MKNVPTFFEEILKKKKNGQNIFPVPLTCHQLFFLSFYGLTQISKWTIRVFLFFISGFVSKNINFVGQIFHGNGKTKSWHCIKSEYNLVKKLNYSWIQLTLLKLRKDCILNCREFQWIFVFLIII